MQIQYPQKPLSDKAFNRVSDPETRESWVFVGNADLGQLGLSGRFDGCPRIEKESVCLPEGREFAEFAQAFAAAFGKQPNVVTIYGASEYVSKIRKSLNS